MKDQSDTAEVRVFPPAIPLLDIVLDLVLYRPWPLARPWLVAWPWVSPTLPRVLWSIVFVALVHQIVSSLGALVGMWASAR